MHIMLRKPFRECESASTRMGKKSKLIKTYKQNLHRLPYQPISIVHRCKQLNKIERINTQFV